MQTFTRLAGARTVAPIRCFGTARALRVKEDTRQSGEELEAAKRQQGQDPKARAELASKSEEHVQADREKVHDHDAHMAKLQKETAGQKEEERAKGQS